MKSYILPTTCTDVLEDDYVFDHLKSSLSKSKSLIDSRIETWSRAASQYTDIDVLFRLIAARGGQNLSRAWLKYWEIVDKFKLIDTTTKDTLRVFCNCELPGAGISAINHLVKTKTDRQLDWIGNSLIGDEAALIDKFNLQLKYPDRWLMSSSMNGDILVESNVKQIIEAVGKVDLYTADGAIDTGSEWDAQESINFPVIESEINIGIKVLKRGGSMLVKLFNIFNKDTRALLEKLFGLFSELWLYKPLTSGQCNSELYVIGKGYKGGNSTDCGGMWSGWPDVAKNFTEEQIKHISKVINNIDKGSRVHRYRIADKWFEQFSPNTLNNTDKL